MAFTDDFTGTEDQYLGDRTGWTYVDGATSAARINASNELKVVTSQSVGSFRCTDQGSANHYSQAIWRSTALAGSKISIRLTDGSNFIGLNNTGTTWQLHKRVSGTLTLLGSYTQTPSGSNLAYIEGDGNSITCKIDGTTRIGPVTETFNNTETRQGVAVRSIGQTTIDPWIDDFEAGALGGGTPIVINLNAASFILNSNPINLASICNLNVKQISFSLQNIKTSILLNIASGDLKFSGLNINIFASILISMANASLTFTANSITFGAKIFKAFINKIKTVLAIKIGL